MKKIPKHFVEGFKSFTGVEPSYEDYMRHPTMFSDSESLYDKYPVLVISSLILLSLFSIWGCIIILK